jgi:hypothetical protein
MKNVRLWKQGKDGKPYVVWRYMLGDDEELEIDNLPELDGPEFWQQIDSHVLVVIGCPVVLNPTSRRYP